MKIRNSQPAKQVTDEKRRGVSGCKFYNLKCLVSWRLLFVLVIVLSKSIICSAQKERSQGLTSMYFGVGPGFGKTGEAGISLSFTLANKWGASLSTKSFVLNAQNMPGDYIRGGGFSYPGLFGITRTAPLNKIPTDFMSLFSFMLVREFTTRTKKIRFGIESGPSWMAYKEAVFTKKVVYVSGDDNYDVEPVQHLTTGISLRAKMELPLNRFAGFEFAVLGNLNKYRAFAGVEVYFTFGFVRERMMRAQ